MGNKVRLMPESDAIAKLKRERNELRGTVKLLRRQLRELEEDVKDSREEEVRLQAQVKDLQTLLQTEMAKGREFQERENEGHWFWRFFKRPQSREA